jgi:hypothetical protein
MHNVAQNLSDLGNGTTTTPNNNLSASNVSSPYSNFKHFCKLIKCPRISSEVLPREADILGTTDVEG